MKVFEPADRLRLIPPYLFKAIDEKKEEVRSKGVDIIDLGVDPDLPTPQFIVDKMKEAVQDPKTHRYPLYSGLSRFREAVTRWYKRRFEVDLDPESEVLTLIGCKEGLAHLPLGVNNPEDLNLIPSPAYPVYRMGSLFAGANCFTVPLLAENDFLPDLHDIPPVDARDAKLFFFNYPNNPTGATASREVFGQMLDFCREYQIGPGDLEKAGGLVAVEGQLSVAGVVHRDDLVFPAEVQHYLEKFQVRGKSHERTRRKNLCTIGKVYPTCGGNVNSI